MFMTEKEKPPEIGKFRRLLPQILASNAKNLILIDIGLAIAFPTIAIPALRGTLESSDLAQDKLHFTENQASWFGSIAFICQPIGCIASGWVTETLGRKRTMLLVNIPHIIAWLMLYFATSVTEMYLAAIILGLGVGFMETPVVTYIGEICEPSIRGILTACTGIAATIGFSIVYFLGTITTWRIAVLVCLSVPLLTIIVICFIPETPLWLLGQNKPKEALKSLQWLRGWVSPEYVDQEYQELQRYNRNSKKCSECLKGNIKCLHRDPTLREKLRDLMKKPTMKPFFVVTMYFMFTQLSGLAGMRPYLVQIFTVYQVPIHPNYATLIVGLLKLSANIVCMISVKFIGKRNLSLFSSASAATCCISLGIYAYNYLPLDISSFEVHINSTSQSEAIVDGNSGIFPMIVLFTLSFVTSIGIAPIPWMLLSEVLPFKSRGVTSGLSAAINYFIVFVATKTYLNLERGLSLSGVVWLYGAIGFTGFMFLFFVLPETENRSLEEIEVHFATKKITKIKIDKFKSSIFGKGHHDEDYDGDAEGVINRKIVRS